MNEIDVCANCGKPYEEHSKVTTQCPRSTVSKWFPKKLADAIEKPYECQKCDSRFGSLSGFNTHMQKDHGENQAPLAR